MKYVLSLAGLLWIGSPCLALCPEGVKSACRKDGKVGTRECVNGRFTPCTVESNEAPTVTGIVTPKFYILTVVYAPPGTQGGGSASQVVYGNGSSSGATTSTTNGFKQGYKVTASADIGIVAGSVSYGYNRNSTNSSALDVKKSENAEITVRGPGVDGIDHDRDQIWLWLSPKVKLSMSPTAASWTFDKTAVADIQFVFVGHLKNPSLMPPGLVQTLQRHGITPADYPKILAADPFAGPAVPLIPDRARFQPLNTTFPYMPPFAQGDPATTFRTTLTSATTTTTASSRTIDHTVGVTVEPGLIVSLFRGKIKAEGSWTWSSTSTTSTATGTAESASVTVGGPSFGYTGPTDISVHYDTIYKSFLFLPLTGLPARRGILRSLSGVPLANEELVVTAGNRKLRTFTDARGEFRIFEALPGALEVQVRGTRKRFTVANERLEVSVP